MKFKIENRDGSVWGYDNISNQITTPIGNVLNTDDIKKQLGNHYKTQIVKGFDPQNYSSLTKSKNLSKLRIQVGLNCNYSCSFCIQHQREDFKTPVTLEPGVNEFFDKLDRCGLTLKDDGQIEIWGGEPLVYIKTLKLLLPKLRERYPNVGISMISNGTLVNASIIDFLIDNKVQLTFSHDAQAYFLRGPDPLDDEAKRLMWLETFEKYQKAKLNFGINCVISQYNADLFDIQNFFATKLSPQIPFGFEGVVMVHAPNSVEFTKFTPSQAKTLKQSIFKAVFECPESMVYRALSARIMRILKILAFQTPSTHLLARCDVARNDVLGVDLQGNVLSCHNVNPIDESIGTLDNFENITPNRYTHWSHRTDCPNCLQLLSCKGSCLRNSKTEHTQGCDVQKMFHGYLFEAVWLMLTKSEMQQVFECVDA